MLESRVLFARPFELPARPFFALRQKERYRSKAADALREVISNDEDQRDRAI